MMDSTHEVMITETAEEAAYYAVNQIPYIVWLNERNKDQSFPTGSYCVENLSDIDARYLDRVYRRFHDIPWDIAETARLRIREITVEDVPQLYELYDDASITQYMEPLFADPEQERIYTREYIKNVYGFYGYGMWVLEDKERGQLIGRAGLEFKEGFEGLELGFMLGVAYQHKGYAYEACTEILSYGVRELDQKTYCSFINEENKASIRLCERLGFAPQGRVRLNEINFDGMMVEKEFIQYVYHAN
ncbi:MAG: GNAT family N-acetyltransferase [Lachnospiraceae bacterium]|nr:GNAT family N-acetyltransferase [Lachnospiraceae bacterium]MDE7272460.1 GNAT family N-acetyltransferase [Lachnospiraceae bacterium]